MEIRHVALPKGGEVSMAIARPVGFATAATPAVLLAHGAGTDRSHPFLVSVQQGLAAAGFLAVTFNFPYREHGRKLPDPRPVLDAAFLAVVEGIRTAADLAPPWIAIGGRSMGGRIATHLAAAGVAVDALVLLGYPLHPAGRLDRLRSEHLPKVHAPTLFVQGTRDTLADPARLRQAIASMPRPTLHSIEHVDHGFHIPRRTGRDDAAVRDEIIEVVVRWLTRLRG